MARWHDGTMRCHAADVDIKRLMFDVKEPHIRRLPAMPAVCEYRTKCVPCTMCTVFGGERGFEIPRMARLWSSGLDAGHTGVILGVCEVRALLAPFWGCGRLAHGGLPFGRRICSQYSDQRLSTFEPRTIRLPEMLVVCKQLNHLLTQLEWRETFTGG